MQFLACVHTVDSLREVHRLPEKPAKMPRKQLQLVELRDPAFQLMCMIVYTVCLSTTHTHIHHRVLCLWRPEETTDTLEQLPGAGSLCRCMLEIRPKFPETAVGTLETCACTPQHTPALTGRDEVGVGWGVEN